MWSGNVLVEGERVTALIDPACCHGHARVDLAMPTLFGRPDPDVYASYPLAADWHERQAIYQLWPAVVHLVLFGAG